MTLTTSPIGPRNIAVIGAGISGMGAAYHLSPHHRVTLFEAEGRLGGHARTRMVGPNRDIPVDTGFIVFNKVNYPHLTALFHALDVPVTESNMSFGASIDGGRIEYGLSGFDAIFAQRRNLGNPRFLRMIRDILRFNAMGMQVAEDDPSLTIGDLIGALGLGSYFRDCYLLPFSGAIWSTPTEKVLDFPAHHMMTFFRNHGLLGYAGQHQWYTVKGGSREYVTRLEAAMRARGVEIRLGAPVAGVRRDALGVDLRAEGAEWERFDDVVFATHSDITLRMLADRTPAEARALPALRYQPNDIVLHSDASLMPRRRKVWSSWTYAEGSHKSTDRIDLSYWMNSLQPWLTEQDYFITLNATRPIRDDLIWDKVVMDHPVYDLAAQTARQEVRAMNGMNRTWFCGAWMKNGFHEDGLASAVDVVEAISAGAGMALVAE
ncbi:MAG: FAD-dependent oxidoreductase [Rubellimicrobium sp.]|nr:FAD-dependent oxidoreductase [Rubellimicrobium sp.]